MERVVVRPSELHGNGVFAIGDLKRGTCVADYTVGSRRMSEEEFLSSYPTGRAVYVWRHPSGVYYDASGPTLAGAINRGGRALRRRNAKIAASGRVVTTRAVREGEEILVSYGRGYRIDRAR